VEAPGEHHSGGLVACRSALDARDPKEGRAASAAERASGARLWGKQNAFRHGRASHRAAASDANQWPGEEGELLAPVPLPAPLPLLAGSGSGSGTAILHYWRPPTSKASRRASERARADEQESGRRTDGRTEPTIQLCPIVVVVLVVAVLLSYLTGYGRLV